MIIYKIPKGTFVYYAVYDPAKNGHHAWPAWTEREVTYTEKEKYWFTIEVQQWKGQRPGKYYYFHLPTNDRGVDVIAVLQHDTFILNKKAQHR